ncbi:hypothetical protein VCH24_63180 [Variovorax boronicumulans]|nr:hypothetical protein VCH24_63180 [Variovorax boronicumulans]
MSEILTAVIGLAVGLMFIACFWHNKAARYLGLLVLFAAFMSRFGWWRAMLGA